MGAKEVPIDAIVDGLLAAATHDYIGLWEIVSRISRQSKLPQEAVRAETLNVLRQLLKNGLVVGDLTSGGGFKQWPVQSTEEVIAKIEMEWDELGHAPEIGDICWLNKI